MDAARRKRIEQVYHAVLQRPPRERSAFLEHACAGDDDLRREVDALLAQPSGFFDAPAFAAAAALVTTDAAPSLIGRRIGSYQVDTRIGAGAMGEVYRARDTRLGRDVALKVLPDAVAADPIRLARFEREARLMAALNHPRIATIHGFEEVDGIRALVLELVEGPTLAERIGRGPVPIGEAVALGLQIGEALEAAHAKGIVHRDLKPANIKVLPGAAVKVLDFGIAKALVGDETGPDISRLPTVTATHATGLIIGTPAYMSPEQARGEPVDRQTDIWAFGCVLYEMLVGRMVFAGKTVSDTLAAVLEHEPDWRALPPTTPAKLRDLLRRCLQKDPKRRLRDVGDAVNELVDLQTPHSSDAGTAIPAAGSQRTAIPVVGASILSAVIAAAVVWAIRPQSALPPPRSVQFTVGADGPDALEPSGLDRDVAISPDGTRLVYVAGGPGRVRLVARNLGELDAARLWDFETPRAPFFSPDGRWLGFFGLFGNLKKISIDGGPGAEISRGVGGASRGATWVSDGTIVFATTDPGTGLLRVPEAGGEAEVLTRPDTAHGELDHFWPEVLPGGRAVLFTIMSPGPIDTAQIALLNLETRTTKILLRGGTAAQYVPTGHLIYGGGGSLHAVPFDPDRGEVTGDPIKVLDRVAVTADGAVNATVSKDGTLAYVRPQSAGAMRTIVWVNRDGRETPIAGAPARPYTYPRLSPDGTRVALEVWDENRDIWVWDLARETLTRLTDTPGRDGFPIWTPDSGRVIFGSARGGSTNLYWRAAAGTGQVERITESPQIQFPYSMSSSGANILLREEHADTGLDISVVPLNGDRRATTLLRTRFNELNAEISPDGRWFAYQSNESGQDEVYVRPFPEVGDDRQQVSTNGGTRPVWARNGRELFYLAPDGLFGVTVAPGPAFKLGSPLRLINRRYFAETAFIGRTYDVSPDGQRFLMIKDDAGDGVRPTIVVVQNWLNQLRARVSSR